MVKINIDKINLEYSFLANSFVSQIEANHNKDYSVVKTFKAGGNSRFFYPLLFFQFSSHILVEFK